MILLRAVIALALTTLISPTHAASQCRVRFNGKPWFDGWIPCDITTQNGIITFEQGNHFTAEVRNDVLRSNVAYFGGPRAKSYKMDSFGKVRRNQIDGGLCYTTPKLEVCSGDTED